MKYCHYSSFIAHYRDYPESKEMDRQQRARTRKWHSTFKCSTKSCIVFLLKSGINATENKNQ